MRWFWQPEVPQDMANWPGITAICYLDHSFSRAIGAVSCKEMQAQDATRIGNPPFTCIYIDKSSFY
jgi:hypothetical protein